MLGVEPERTAEVQHEQTKPLDKRLVLDTPEQLAHGRSIADHTRFNAFGDPRATGSLAPPVPPLDAVFALHVLRFVAIDGFTPNEKSRESPACGVVFN